MRTVIQALPFCDGRRARHHTIHRRHRDRRRADRGDRAALPEAPGDRRIDGAASWVMPPDKWAHALSRLFKGVTTPAADYGCSKFLPILGGAPPKRPANLPALDAVPIESL